MFEVNKYFIIEKEIEVSRLKFDIPVKTERSRLISILL